MLFKMSMLINKMQQKTLNELKIDVPNKLKKNCSDIGN